MAQTRAIFKKVIAVLRIGGTYWLDSGMSTATNSTFEKEYNFHSKPAYLSVNAHLSHAGQRYLPFSPNGQIGCGIWHAR
eukprot:scaffold781_cov132-Cylindrotheca_fusiformis.AAC.23